MLSILLDRSHAAPDTVLAYDVEGRTATWGQLKAAVERWAGRLASAGVSQGAIVVTLRDASLDSLALWLGIASLGAIEASINAEYRGRMLVHAIDTCDPSLIVADEQYCAALEAVCNDLAKPRRVLVAGEVQRTDPAAGLLSYLEVAFPSAEAARASFRPVMPSWHDIACVTFTSGTTGPSKAVRIPWGQLLAINLASFPFVDLGPDDVFYCFTAHAHFGSKAIPFQAAMAGGRVVVRTRFSLSAFWPDIERFGITCASLVGTMADTLMRSVDSPESTSLRNLFMAPLGPSYRQFAERFDLRICTVYNSTENGVPICSGWNPDHESTVGKLRSGFPGFEVRLVDAHDREVPEGTAGECIVRSAIPWTMNAGYLNNPAATTEAWRNGWFHTGDALLRQPDGNYVFVDRLKDVIRRRGENISSYEVELDVRGNGTVAECAAVAVPADTAEDEILLFVTLKQGVTMTAAELHADLMARMPRFMVPRYIEIIDAMPKTQATERIVKSDLRARGLGPETWDAEADPHVLQRPKHERSKA